MRAPPRGGGGGGDVSLLLVELERRRDRGVGFAVAAGRPLHLGEREPDPGADVQRRPSAR